MFTPRIKKNQRALQVTTVSKIHNSKWLTRRDRNLTEKRILTLYDIGYIFYFTISIQSQKLKKKTELYHREYKVQIEKASRIVSHREIISRCTRYIAGTLHRTHSERVAKRHCTPPTSPPRMATAGPRRALCKITDLIKLTIIFISYR